MMFALDLYVCAISTQVALSTTREGSSSSLTSISFEHQVLDVGRPTLVYFHGPRCKTCNRTHSIWQQVREAYMESEEIGFEAVDCADVSEGGGSECVHVAIRCFTLHCVRLTLRRCVQALRSSPGLFDAKLHRLHTTRYKRRGLLG